MKFPIKFLAGLFTVLFIYGCDSNQYQIVTGQDGMLYRFNKKTGEMSMVMDDKKVVQLAETKKTDILKDKTDGSLARPVNWKESKYPGKDLKAKLETVWRENKLCYRFTIYPYDSLEKMFARKKQDYVYSLMKPGFNIELLDKNSFLVKEIKVNLWSMSKIPGNDGNIKELMMNSQIECSRQSYRSIGGYSIKWLLDPDLIADEKDKYIKSTPLKSGKN